MDTYEKFGLSGFLNEIYKFYWKTRNETRSSASLAYALITTPVRKLGMVNLLLTQRSIQSSDTKTVFKDLSYEARLQVTI